MRQILVLNWYPSVAFLRAPVSSPGDLFFTYPVIILSPSSVNFPCAHRLLASLMSSQKLSNRQWIYTKDYGLSQKTLSQALIRLSTSKVEVQ
jgi:hypothetical protein